MSSKDNTVLTKTERKECEGDFKVNLNQLSKQQQIEVLKMLYLLSGESIQEILYTGEKSLKINTDTIPDDVLKHVSELTKNLL